MITFKNETAMKQIHSLFGRITGFHTEKISLDETFENFAGRFSHIPGTVILLSGGDLDCSRYHIMGTKPWLTFSAGRRDATIFNTESALQIAGNPLDALKRITTAYALKTSGSEEFPSVPISCGLMGYLSYDVKDCIEDLPGTCINASNLPHILLFAQSIIVVHDRLDDTTRLFIPRIDTGEKNSIDENLVFFRQRCNAEDHCFDDRPVCATRLNSNFTRENYVRAVETIKEYIASGHVYQVNMSQRFEADFTGDPYVLFKTYYDLNPAPFYAYINAGNHQVVSTSPERFILRQQDRIETRPIKGTRPRGHTPEEDQRLRNELFNSKKDDAELSMIVDLLRNDIGKVCVGGSVRVAEHKRLEAYQNVYHLVSVVEGKLDKAYDSIDVIRAVFPGGSITGCPKIGAMEIIDEMETNNRHIYTGSIGYISFHDTMDLSIAIRTATIHNGKMVFSVGGGIVYDSDPEDEFDETLHKGRTLMSVFGKESFPQGQPEKAWINGAVVPLDQALIPVSHPGFQYGFGFFETIRAVNGKPKNLAAHVQRFETTWKHLFSGAPPDLTWDELIRQVLVQNHLENTTAAVKIIAAKGTREIPPFNNTLAVTARPYTHRLEGKKEPGINLVTYPHPRQTPLASHKTLNYLYYYLAGKWAADQGGDEALILNPDGTLSETNTANLILIKGKIAILPESSHVLLGTMEKTVCGLLLEWGYTIEKQVVFPEDLFSYDDTLMTNSLIGAVPVLMFDGKKLKPPTNLWQEINRVVLYN